MSTVVCWFQRTLKQLEREQTDRQTDRYTDRQDNYSNPRACAPRVNELQKPYSVKIIGNRVYVVDRTDSQLVKIFDMDYVIQTKECPLGPLPENDLEFYRGM